MANSLRNATFHELTFPNNDRRSAATFWLFRSYTYYVVLARKIRELICFGQNQHKKRKCWTFFAEMSRSERCRSM